MKEAERGARLNFRRGMRGVGVMVAEDAKQRASAYSSTIPGTIKPRVAGATIEIRAGETGKPLARLFETGNLRRGKIQGSVAWDPRPFRHPMYGNRGVWKNQATHAYLYPAAAANLYKGRRILIGVFEEALLAQRIPVKRI